MSGRPTTRRRALAFLAFVLLLPLVAVCVEALRQGFGAYLRALQEPDAWSALKLSLLVAAIAVPANLVFGIAAAWLIAGSRKNSVPERRRGRRCGGE